MEEKRVLTLNKYDYAKLLTILNEYRNKQIQEDKPTEAINILLYALLNAPYKQKTIFKRERVI